MAFQGSYERNPDTGEPTPDAMLGALMMAEAQNAQIKLLELTNEWAKGWARSKRGRHQ